jgi:hypothetical protein
MAKKTDDFDDFGEGAAGTDADAGGAKGGPLSKLPIGGLVEKLTGLVDNVRTSVSASFGDQDRPTLPIILLGAGVLALVMVLIVMVVLLVGSLSGAAGAEPVAASHAAPRQEVPAASPAAGLSPTEEAPLVSSARPADARQPLTDPYFRTPILMNEFKLMQDGEIRYGRQPQRNWGLPDIRPGWQELGVLYKKLLREQNTRDFYKLLGAEEPAFDQY